MKVKKTLITMIIAIIFCGVVSCSATEETYGKEAESVAIAQEQINKNQPIHTYPYSWERELFQQMFDARMSASTTYNYRIDERDGFQHGIVLVRDYRSLTPLN